MTMVANLSGQFAKRLCVALACIITISVSYIVINYFNRPLVGVEINLGGSLNVEQEQQVRQVITQYYAMDAMDIDIYTIQHQLAQIAWVKEVSVKRQAQHQLSIRISKRNLIAFWQDDSQLIDAQGKIITRVSSEQYNLPVLVASERDKHYILGKYLWFKENLLKIANIEIQHIIFKDNIWNIISNQGMLIKLDDVKHNEKISRLARIYPKIKRRDKIASINLNYDRGLSVAWLKK
jgi:cell division septal protein FtsQ